MAISKRIIVNDIHLTGNGYYPVWDTVKEFIKYDKPDVIYINGDFVECEALSPHLKGKYSEATHDAELRVIDEELKFLEKYCKKIVWIEGNHEAWVNKYEAKHPAMRGLLGYEKQLNLKKRGIKWIPLGEDCKVGKLHIFHGIYINEHHAKKHVLKFGCSVCYGHTHVSQTHTNNQVKQTTHKAWGLACLCNKKASFLVGQVEGSWNHEFARLYVFDNGHFNLLPIEITNNQFVYAGRLFGKRL